jgi:2-dehydropantoate 2-reductase
MTLRILVLGAGATGGYFGGRLLQAGRDVTFLVRPSRAAELSASGLVIRSPYGNVTLADPPTITDKKIAGPFDLILLSCKAYDLDSAIAAIVPAVGSDTMILPLLNGMHHLDMLDHRFGRANVLGGLCVIAATLDDERAIVHLNDLHSLSFGERDGGLTDRIQRIAAVLCDAGFEARPSEHIVQDLWEKWVFLATLAGITCLMRASIGTVLASTGGPGMIGDLFDECCKVAVAAGHVPRPAFIERSQAMLMNPDSTLTASMLRDMEAGFRIEADHIVGDLLHRMNGGENADLPLLRLAYTHMKAYETRRVGAPAAKRDKN